MKHKISLFLTAALFVLIIGGVLLRFTLFHMAFEYDELFTAITSDPSLSLGWIWNNWLVVDVHPPLYNVLLWIYNHFVPYGSEMWLRVPSAVFGLGALACAWFLFPKRFGKTARLIFVSLLACNAYMILYTQHARAYSLMLLLSIPLTFWFLNMSRTLWQGEKPVSLRQWVLFGVCSLLLAWTHYFGALLVGVYSILLLAQAWRYKRRLTMFIVVPALVGLLFLPWFIPNFLAQLEFQRFAGNWWANILPASNAPIAVARFFLFSRLGLLAVVLLVAASVLVRGLCYKRTGSWGPHARELGLLGITILLVFLAAGLISLKAYMFIGRYFTELMPAVYLTLALLLAPLVRKRLIVQLAFVVVVALELFMYASGYRAMLEPRAMPSRLISDFYRDFFRGKEMMVVAMEAFPPASMPAMYGFYVNRVHGLNVKVTELVQLDEAARDEALARSREAFVFMPNCEDRKLEELFKRWKRGIGIYARLGSTCILGFSEKEKSPAAEPAPEPSKTK